MRHLPILLSFLALHLVAAEAVWLEGESPSAPVHQHLKTATVERAGTLSGGKWLHLNVAAKERPSIPADGIAARYDFAVEMAGSHAVWARTGFESIRAPFSWRIDGGDWRAIPAEKQPYVDLVEAGFWCELAWMRLGEIPLAVGNHSLEFRIEAQGTAEKPANTVWALDCICVTTTPFRPRGALKPGDSGTTEDDRAAAATTFELKQSGDTRSEVGLLGRWQVARHDEWEPVDRTGPDRTVPPGDELHWTSIPVPGDRHDLRPDLNFAHRVIYRTHVDIDPALAGRSFILRIPRFNMIASVLVNGRFCGWSKAMNAQWDCDVTRAIEPGRRNEIQVVIKDTYYGISPTKSQKPFSRIAFTPLDRLTKNFTAQFLDFPVAEFPYTGLLDTAPSLIACGGVYAADVFAIPSLKQKSLAVEVGLANPGPTAARARVSVSILPLEGGQAAKTFAAKEVDLAADGATTLRFEEGWTDPRLWWPDDPHQYVAVVETTAAGRPTDISRTKFGFREWECRGNQFLLNGIPWHGRTDCSSRRTPEEFLAMLRAYNANLTVVGWYRGGYGPTWSYVRQGEALDFFDRNGIVVQRQNMFNGRMADYMQKLADPELFANYRNQLLAMIREDRNHPSIFIWQLENEIAFINARNLHLSKQVDPMLSEVARAAMAFDPTRPVTVGGGRCLLTEDLPVNGCHYDEAPLREYPEEAYTSRLLAGSANVRWNNGPTSPWRLIQDRPVFHNEGFFLRGFKPEQFSLLGGESCFGGWKGCRAGAGLYARILSEGYRWQGVGAFHFWQQDHDVTPYYNAWSPIAVLSREWNWTFAGGSELQRTLRVLNDTRFADPIELAWELTVNGVQAGKGTRTCKPAPGGHEEIAFTMPLPAVSARTQGELTLICLRGGREVFRDRKELALIPADGGPKPACKAGELVVIDPQGAVRERLAKRGIAFTELAAEAAIPAAARVLIIGSDALDARAATDPRWLAFASRGGRVLVLDQANPMRHGAIPADLDPTTFAGRVAFMERPEHPAFRSLGQSDFFTWSGDQIVYRNAYAKATRGARSLMQCDAELSLTCLDECEVNEGLLVLCQMPIGGKLGGDAVAQRLFDNLLEHCASYRLQSRQAATVLGAGDPRGRMLAEAGLQATTSADPLAAIAAAGPRGVAVVDATPAALKELAGSLAVVERFREQGGWLFLWGVTPEGLADFNRLVGVEQAIRPFECERVSLSLPRDPLAAGLSDRDIVMDSGEKIFPFCGGNYLADDVFSHIIELDDVAPFCAFPNAQAGDHAAARKADAGWSRNVVNGFTSNDAWKLIHYLPFAQPRLTLTLPRAEAISEFSVILNTHQAAAKRVRLFLDEDPAPLEFSTKPEAELRQDFAIEPPRKASRIAIELGDFDITKPNPSVTGIDNLWLRTNRDEVWRSKVKPILNIGGLVRYPQGAGGTVLCQVALPQRELVAANAQKRRQIVTTLLRNLGACFAGGRTLVAGADLAYEPVPLNEACNLYLGKEQGWFSNQADDLRRFPLGDQTFCGVRYQIRDFTTSVLPVAVALTAPHTKTALPAAVNGIPVGRKADGLFFLHTWNRTKAWASSQKDAVPPTVFNYVIHYADGQTASVPVKYGQGVDHWQQKTPVGLPQASVAWAAPCPDNASGAQAVVYQMQWDNPRPEVAIASIDVAYDAKEKQSYGTPVVLGISTARSATADR